MDDEIKEAIEEALSVAKASLHNLANDDEFWMDIAKCYGKLYLHLRAENFGHDDAMQIIKSATIPGATK